MTLMELTGHEAGIILYGGKTVAVWNWGQCGDDQMPALSPLGGMLNWQEEHGVFDGAEGRRVDDIREELPGSIWMTDETDEDGSTVVDTDLDIVNDDFNDLARLCLGINVEGIDAGKPLSPEDYEGKAFILRDGRKILVLDMWN